MTPSSVASVSSATRSRPLPITTRPAVTSTFAISANARIDAATFFSFSRRATTRTIFLKSGYRARLSSGSALARLSISTNTGNTAGAAYPRATSESAMRFETTRTASACDKRNRASRTLRRLPVEREEKEGSNRSVCTCRWSLLPRIHAIIHAMSPIRNGSWEETTSGRWIRHPAAIVRNEPKTRPSPKPRTAAFPAICTSCFGPCGTSTSMRSTMRACIRRRLVTALVSLKAFQSVESTSTRIRVF